MPTTPTPNEDPYVNCAAESVELDASSEHFVKTWPAARYVRSEKMWVEDGSWLSPQTVRRRLREAGRGWSGGEKDTELELRQILGVDAMPAPRRSEDEVDAAIVDFRREMPNVRFVRDQKLWFDGDHPTFNVRRRLRQALRIRGVRGAGWAEDTEHRLRQLLAVGTEAEMRKVLEATNP